MFWFILFREEMFMVLGNSTLGWSTLILLLKGLMQQIRYSDMYYLNLCKVSKHWCCKISGLVYVNFFVFLPCHGLDFLLFFIFFI